MEKTIKLLFWALMGFFVLVMAVIFVPDNIGGLFKGPLFLLPIFIFSFLGALLRIMTLKEKGEPKLRKFLILTGASAAGFFICILLHNAFYALAVIFQHITIIKYLMEALHVFFFFLAIPICPLGFLIGIAGSIGGFFKKINNYPEI